MHTVGVFMYVKPAAGILVRDPITRQHLPEDGMEVPDSQYWQRRIADGDVIATESKHELAARKLVEKKQQAQG